MRVGDGWLEEKRYARYSGSAEEPVPGKRLLIELYDSEAETGTVLVAHKDPEIVDREMERVSQLKMIRRKPLYVTYSIPEGQDMPAIAL
jgi:hypothetical protein